jgi:monoamine oxidase
LLFGTGQAVQTPEQTIAAFRSFYPGKTPDTIEQCVVHQWWKEEPTCVGCEREPFPFGQMTKIWPHLIESVGRVHFAGAAYDNLWRGMEAATRSANRVAGQIDGA